MDEQEKQWLTSDEFKERAQNVMLAALKPGADLVGIPAVYILNCDTNATFGSILAWLDMLAEALASQTTDGSVLAFSPVDETDPIVTWSFQVMNAYLADDHQAAATLLRLIYPDAPPGAQVAYALHIFSFIHTTIVEAIRGRIHPEAIDLGKELADLNTGFPGLS